MKKISWNQDWTFYKEGEEERQSVTLPHDAMIHEERKPDCPSGSGGAFFPGGIYWYEKEIANWEELSHQHVEIGFEGVYRNASVYLNDELLLEHPYGYTPFGVVLDGKWRKNGRNILKVRVDNSKQPNSRWYTGSGIYRSMWMYVSGPAYIHKNGIRIRTESIQPPAVRVSVKHEGDEARICIKDGARIVKTAVGDEVLMELPDARLWDEADPKLYTCHVDIMKDGKKADEAEESFGIRTISWNAKGLYVNDKPVLLRGGCLHHDNGILGACSYDESEERKIQKLKEAGYNAVRSAHNPASPGMLKACDKLGMYVMDETWDVWYSKKTAHDYSENFMDHYQEDIQAMVDRDFNHPCVIMYSIGNEVSEPAQERGVKLAQKMKKLFYKLDDSRPVTGGINLMILVRSAAGNAVYKEEGGVEESDAQKQKPQAMTSTVFNQMTAAIGTGMNNSANSQEADRITTPILDLLDIAGYNYASGRYPIEGEAHPDRIVVGSETFPQDIVKNWDMVKKYPYLIGDFVWTAWDYLGETGLGAWAYSEDASRFDKPYPWLLADAGVMDILGNPTGELYLAQAAWGLLKKPMIAVRPVNHPDTEPFKAVWRGTNSIPYWSWRGCEGNKAVVEVYGDASEAQLFLNGTSLGKSRLEGYRAVFEIPYEPGTLEAVLYGEDGEEIGRNSLTSSEGALTIGLSCEKERVYAKEPIYIELDIRDQHGNVECNRDQQIRVKVKGGRLLAFGSANPRTEERFDSGEYTTYYGKGQIVVMGDKPGEIQIMAKSRELPEAEIRIRVDEAKREE